MKLIGSIAPTKPLLLLAILAAVLVSPPAQTAGSPGPWAEVGDAGELPATAQVPTGVGALDSISGTIGTDADMYRICLTGGGSFSAVTHAPGTATFDTQLFLFDSTGSGVYANDDDGITLLSNLPAGDPFTPTAAGTYYLAISEYDNDPVSPGGLIFPSSPFTSVFGPSGPGGGSPISGWTGGFGVGGTYTIALTGAEFCSGGAPGTDDKIASLGKFRIIVNDEFVSLMEGYPGFDGVSRLDSPTLFDPNTVVGRSTYHLDGDATDTGGAIVGTAGTIISDADFSLVPPGVEGPPGSREIHTEIVELNMTGPLGAAVRAGTDAPGRPISPGEVESQSSSGNPVDDFPATSFFNVFVEVDLPAFASFPGGTLYNPLPLLVVNNNLTDPPGLPPRVVYIHGNTEAIAVLFRDTDPGGSWQADDLFGWLVLAGHGAGFDDTPEDTDEFEQTYQDEVVAAGEPPIGDTDGDGCTDDRELQPKALAAAGGARDPLFFWDFFDTWATGSRTGNIDGFDIGDVVTRFGTVGGVPATKEEAVAQALTPPVNNSGYHTASDRDAPEPGANVWNVREPNGFIDGFDIGMVVVQFGHTCG